MQCSHCQREVAEGARFCGYCGTAVTHEQCCEYCGLKNPTDFAFCSGCGKVFAQTSWSKEKNLDSKTNFKGDMEAERRQLTVMFCDLIGSTALSEQLDPEDLRDVILSYQQVCAQSVKKYDGYIAKYLGDGILIYFGYPIAHEDDALRSVYTGLKILLDMERLNRDLEVTRGLQIGVRMGIHTGLVVAGEMGSGDTIEELAIVGKTPNIAARLEGEAPKNSIAVSPATYRITKDAIEFCSLGKRSLKGIAEPMEVFQVTSVKEDDVISLQDEAYRAHFVGREQELSLLSQCWQSACQGRRQVVFIGGEGGIGKSRLLQHFCKTIKSEDVIQLSFSCNAYMQNSAFYPIKMFLLYWLNIAKNDEVAVKKSKLENSLKAMNVERLDTDALFLLSIFLEFINDNPSQKLKLTPQKVRERTMDLLVAIIIMMSEEKPVLICCEDTQWMDPSSLSFMKQLEERSYSNRMMFMLSSRPPYGDVFMINEYTTHCILSGLDFQETTTLVKSMDHKNQLPPSQIERLVLKTDGVPLFIEEMVSLMIGGDVSSADSLIPERLRDVLTSRLDKLGSAKDIVQLAAAIGMEFGYELLQAVSHLSEERLSQDLMGIMKAGLMSRSGLSSTLTYVFRHGLVQEVAYLSLLKKTRKRIHKRVAEVLVEGKIRDSESVPEIIAKHYALGGEVAQAREYWLQAGNQAARKFALVEASRFFEEGLKLFPSTVTDEKDALIELSFLVGLANCQMPLFGFSSKEVENTIERTKELSERVKFASAKLFPVYYGLWVFALTRGKLKEAVKHAQRFLILAEQEKGSSGLLMAHRCLGIALFYVGEIKDAATHLKYALDLYDEKEHRVLAFSYGQDPASPIWSFYALSQCLLGHKDESLQLISRARKMAHESGHPTAEIYAETASAWLSQLQGDARSCRIHAENSVRLATEQSYHLWTGWNTCFLGWAIAEEGDIEKGLLTIEKGMDMSRKMGAKLFNPYWILLYARILLSSGKQDEAKAMFIKARTAAEENSEYWIDDKLYTIV